MPLRSAAPTAPVGKANGAFNSSSNNNSSSSRRPSSNSSTRPLSNNLFKIKGSSRNGFSNEKYSDFEFDPLNNLSLLESHPRSKYRARSLAHISTDSSSSNTINDDLEQNHSHNRDISIAGNAPLDQEKERVREAGQLATVLLEIRKGLMSDLHYDNSHIGKDHGFDIENDPSQHISSSMPITRSTLQRAEKVKAMLNLYYFCLFQSQKVNDPKYEGVDGVYNPLQIIRNRKIRKKYHELPKLAIKTIPHASTVFSKNKRSIIWEIDYAELTYDTNWRSHHWHELLNPKGEYWFPLTPEEEEQQKRHHHHHSSTGTGHHHRHNLEAETKHLHDKLFESIEDDHAQKLPSGTLAVPTTSRNRSKSPARRLARKLLGSRDALNEINKDSYLQTPPSLVKSNSSTDESFKGSLLNDVYIEPLRHHRMPSSTVTTASSEGVSSLLGGQGITSPERIEDEQNDKEVTEETNLKEWSKKLIELETLVRFSRHHFVIKDEEYSKTINFDQVVKNRELLLKEGHVFEHEILAKFSKTVNYKSLEMDSYQNELLNNFSPRIDKLLSLSDRTIGEVNTTLSLQIRKMNERLEKLGPIHKRSGSLINLMYWLLENLVVLLLWSIWIGFSIAKVFKFFALLLWKFVKWVFY